MSKHTHDEVLERAYSAGPKTSTEAVLGLFSAHANPPSMDARSRHDLVIRAAKEHAAMLDALRKASDRLAICCELQPDQKERDTIWAWVEEARNALPRGTP